jgi:hypothetical protein
VEQALQTIKDAETLDHPLTLSIALVSAVSVFLWVGDLETANEHINRLFSQAEVHSLGPYLAVGRGFKRGSRHSSRRRNRRCRRPAGAVGQRRSDFPLPCPLPLNGSQAVFSMRCAWLTELLHLGLAASSRNPDIPDRTPE